MGDLRISFLVDMCEFIIDCPHFTPEWTDSGFVVIRNQNIRDGRLDLSDPSFTHYDDFQRRIKRAKPKAGDIIFTREAPMGEVCFLPEGLECCVGQRQVLLRPKHNIDGRYLFFALRSQYVRHQIFWNEGTGSTVSNVRIPVLKALKIPRLGDSETPIADLLSALEGKIELNRQTNETLEALARALFKDWFVDFGPTRAKAEGRSPYLAPELWALFPDALDDEDKPEGWTSFRLNGIAEQFKGAVSPLRQPNRLFEHYSLPAFDDGQEPVLEPGEKIKSNKSIIAKGAVLLSKLNPEITRVWLPNQSNDSLQVSSAEFLVFKPKKPAGRSILYCLFKSDDFRKKIIGMVTGTSKSHQRVSPNALLELDVLTGSLDVFEAFERIIIPLIDKMLADRRENRALAQTRDLLLPKLMSGEIRIKDAERIIGEVV